MWIYQNALDRALPSKADKEKKGNKPMVIPGMKEMSRRGEKKLAEYVHVGEEVPVSLDISKQTTD